MLKLTKYELRKNLLGIGIVAGIICVLQALFMFFCLTENLNYTSLFGGLLITDAEGCIVFESNSKTKCFQQAIAWIEGNECDNIF